MQTHVCLIIMVHHGTCQTLKHRVWKKLNYTMYWSVIWHVLGIGFHCLRNKLILNKASYPGSYDLFEIVHWYKVINNYVNWIMFASMKQSVST